MFIDFGLILAFFGAAAMTLAIALVSILAAYENGVTDGYGYAKEPNCPGYKQAGEYLKKNMAHRWPELADEPKVSV